MEEELISFERSAVSLRVQPQRPGELTELIDVVVDAATLERLGVESPALLPRELALYIAIEAQRALDEAAQLFGIAEGDLADELDRATLADHARDLSHVLLRPLEEYARAIERGLQREFEEGTSVRVRAPQHVAARWAQAASTTGEAVEHWISDVLNDASGARIAWEASAARSAHHLSEWVLVQTARWARSRRTPPQMTALG